MRFLTAVLALCAGLSALPVGAQQAPVPDRRVIVTEGVDYPGTDLQALFDTTYDACEQACLGNDQCVGFTFNTRSNSCFPKSEITGSAPYAGAFSAKVVDVDQATRDLALQRMADLPSLPSDDFDGARDLAQRIGDLHVSGEWSADDHLNSAADARKSGDLVLAGKFVGAALSLADRSDIWVEYGRLMLDQRPQVGENDRPELVNRAYGAALNGYLRASRDPARAAALALAGEALTQMQRGADAIPLLKLAQDLQPRDEVAAMLADAIAKFGFRIEETAVESDLARPRICATFNQQLKDGGFDYAPYVRAQTTGLAVTSDYNQICIAGVEHGVRYAVTFRQGLPAMDGEVLAQDTEITLYVRDRAPSVRFPGRAYVLPRSTEAALPVETVNTKSIDLVLRRVSDRNLLRAIQNDYFGRSMVQYEEQDFAANVAEELWRGTGDVAMEVNRDVTTRLPLDGVIAGLPAGIYALSAAIAGQDPYDNPGATQWFVISDLGVTTLSGTDGLHVFVRSLGTAAAKEGVTVSLLSRANAVLGTVKTDADGYARFDAALTRGTNGAEPALVEVTDGDTDIAFLSLTDPEFDLSDRGVEGREAAPPVDLFLTTDRGAYRAGETIYATALTRDPLMNAIEGLPLTAVLTRPDGVEYSRAIAPDGGAGGHVFALPVAGSAPRGPWRLEMRAEADGPALASTTVLVEDFLPERIDFTLALPDGAVRLGDSPDLTITARYLFGAKGAGLPVEGEVTVRPLTTLAALPGYQFGLHDQYVAPQTASIDPGIATDEDGIAVVPLTFPEMEDPRRPLEMRVTARLTEGSGRPVERQVSKILAPAAPMIGIKPQFDGVVPEGAEAGFDLIAIGPDVRLMALPVKWTLNRIETQYQWYRQYGNWNWEPTTTRTRVAEGAAALGADGPVSVAAPVQWGEYELKVESADGDFVASSVSFYAGWYAPADASETPDTLELSLDKPAYLPGETATLRLVPRAAGVALISVMSNHLIAMQAVNVTAGENIVKLPVTDEWGAGAYVTASVIRPMDVTAGHNPSRALGLSYAAVDPGARRLQAAVEVAAEVEPRGPLDVAVRVDGVAAGEMAYVTLAAVDQGILNLTGFQPPDPDGHYFGQQKLGMAIRDIYGRLIDGLNGDLGAVRSGGDSGSAKLQSPPPTEELVAYFSGPLQVGADGTARTTFDLPSFNGTVKVMAVVWTRSGVGQASADVLVRDPVVVTASVPRFMAPGDDSRVLLEIVHAKGPAGRVGLDVTAEGLTLGKVPSGVDLAEGGKQVVSIPLTASATGLKTLRVALTTPDGRQLVKLLTLPVQVGDPVQTVTSRFELAKGDTFTFDANVFAGFNQGSASATLAMGPLARFDAPGLLASLDRYPYGCTEQITSKALPLLYLSDVAAAMGMADAKGIEQRVTESIAEVLTNQDSNGAFGLWEPSSGDPWLDAYVTDFLSRARAQGFAVPDNAFRMAMDNLRNHVNYAPDFDSGGGDLAYALMVLAREGAAAVGDLRYYADVKADAFDTPLGAAQLGAALAMYGDQTRADAMFKRAAALVRKAYAGPEAQLYRADYGTRRRDAAAVLALATEAGSTAVDTDSLAKALAIATPFGLSTQESTWALLATHAMIGAASSSGITIDGAPATGPLVRVLDAATAGGSALAIANGGAKPATLTLTTMGIPEVPLDSGGNGYAIKRTWYTMEGAEVSPDQVQQGARLVTVIEVNPFGGGEARLMVNDPLPAGFEIDNPNLMASGDVAALDWLDLNAEATHAEFRQDRFLAAVDWYGKDPFRLAYIVRAVSPGSFHLPAASVEDMYRPDYRAWTAAGRVVIAAR